jgi:hypothetical protein
LAVVWTPTPRPEGDASIFSDTPIGMPRDHVYHLKIKDSTGSLLPTNFYPELQSSMPSIVYNLFAIPPETTRGFVMMGDLFVRTTEPIYRPYLLPKHRIYIFHEEIPMILFVEFLEYAYTPTRRNSYFELKPWER